jgi:pyruvate,water dikinase
MAAAFPPQWLCALPNVGLDAIALCGGKAVGLAALARAGLPVPPAVVVTHAAFMAVVQPGPPPDASAGVEAWAAYWASVAANIDACDVPTTLLAALQTQVASWGALAVRSSMAVEDSQRGAAPGLFASRTHVAVPALADALRAVWASACTPMVAQYRAHRNNAATGFGVAVVVQDFVEGDAVVVYTRRFGAPESSTMMIQRDGATHEVQRSADDAIVRLALAAEAAIDAAATGADVELIVRPSGELAVVQARAIVQPPVPKRDVRAAPPDALIASMRADGRVWTLDFAHNPTPLSTAQAELVQAVQAAGIAPFSLRLCAGYLYSATGPSVTAYPLAADAAGVAAQWATLAARIETQLRPDDDSLQAAVRSYLAFYDLWANDAAPLIKAARRGFHDAMANAGLAAQATALAAQLQRPSAIDRQLQRCAAGELDETQLQAQLGDVATEWDVAAATYREHWATVQQTLARLRAAPPTTTAAMAPVALAPALQQAYAIAALGTDYAEQDDLWFFRAQANVRRALLRLAARLDIASDDIWWLSWSLLDDVEHFDNNRAHAIARAARAAAQRAALWHMPLVIGSEAPTPAAVAGGGPTFTGTVVRLQPHMLPNTSVHAQLGPRTVVVTRALTPGLALALAGIAGIVCDSGGLLDHGAAMARELGIPYVVGASDVYDRCHDGQRIAVDPSSGTVTLLD